MRLRIGACMATAMALALGGAGVARVIWNAIVQPDL